MQSDKGDAAVERFDWADIAASSLHWLARDGHDRECWMRREREGDGKDQLWSGWCLETAEPTTATLSHAPWQALMDDSLAPVLRWYVGGRTNAAFNEIDSAVLAAPTSAEWSPFICEPSRDEFTSSVTSLRSLLLASARIAQTGWAALGIEPGQRVALYAPNDGRAVVWMEAAKRMGTPYVAIAAGSSSATLADRLADTGAVVLVTTAAQSGVVLDALAGLHASVSAPVVVLLEGFIDEANNRAEELTVPSSWLNAHALLTHPDALTDHTLKPGRPDPVSAAPQQFVAHVWSAAAPALPVEASWPLFILYTSGSTGKPKGIVHVHGGYEVGLRLSAERVLGLPPPDGTRAAPPSEGGSSSTLMVVATPGWITGQSYMIAAALLTRTPSLLLEGSPVAPPDRFARLIARHQVSVLKAGSTFLRMLMTLGDGTELLRGHDVSSLRLGVFCAEPVNHAVHRFATEHLTPNYINAYWATEHGAMIFGEKYAPLRHVTPDARSRPLPWIDADVWRLGGIHADEGDEKAGGARRALDDEAGDLVLTTRPPHMALAVWRSEGFATPNWTGDRDRWAAYFRHDASSSPPPRPSVWLYVQGDAATRHADGAYTFHGRSDEVINIGGNRIGTAEIESAMLERRAEARVRNAVVVGVDDAVLGTSPVAFVVPQMGATIGPRETGALRNEVAVRLGSIAVPSSVIVVDGLPETYSGKYMRRVLQQLMLEHEKTDAEAGIMPPGLTAQLAACRNPECVPPLRAAIRQSRIDRENEQPGDTGAYDSLSLFQGQHALSPALERTYALQGALMFLVAISVTHSHYQYNHRFYRPLATFLTPLHLLDSYDMQLAFLLTGRAESVAVVNWRFITSKIGKPALLLAVWRLAALRFHTTDTLVRDTETYPASTNEWLRVDAVWMTFELMWFVLCLILLRIVRALFYLAGDTTGSVTACVSVGVYLLSQPHVLNPAFANAWSLRTYVYASGACEANLPTFDLRQLLWHACSTFLPDSMATEMWLFYSIAPWALHLGPQVLPFITAPHGDKKGKPSSASQPVESSVWRRSACKLLVVLWCTGSLACTARVHMSARSWTPSMLACNVDVESKELTFGSNNKFWPPKLKGYRHARARAAATPVLCCSLLRAEAASGGWTLAVTMFRSFELRTAWVGATCVGCLCASTVRILGLLGPRAALCAELRELTCRCTAIVIVSFPAFFHMANPSIRPDATSLPVDNPALRNIIWAAVQQTTVVCMASAWVVLLPKRHSWLSRAGLGAVFTMLGHKALEVPAALATEALLQRAEAVWLVMLPSLFWGAVICGTSLVLMLGVPSSIRATATIGNTLLHAANVQRTAWPSPAASIKLGSFRVLVPSRWRLPSCLGTASGVGALGGVIFFLFATHVVRSSASGLLADLHAVHSNASHTGMAGSLALAPLSSREGASLVVRCKWAYGHAKQDSVESGALGRIERPAASKYHRWTLAPLMLHTSPRSNHSLARQRHATAATNKMPDHPTVEAAGTSQIQQVAEPCGARVLRKESRSPCVVNVSFGCDQTDPGKMWVEQGCRGTFRMTHVKASLRVKAFPCGAAGGARRRYSCPEDARVGSGEMPAIKHHSRAVAPKGMPTTDKSLAKQRYDTTAVARKMPKDQQGSPMANDRMVQITKRGHCCRSESSTSHHPSFLVIFQKRTLRSPEACIPICLANATCTYFSYSAKWTACHLCTGCEMNKEGKSLFYTSWRREPSQRLVSP